MTTTPVAIVDVDADLLLALEEAFGPPIDSYLMGWQVWLVEADVEGEEVTFEYRVHPPHGFAQPAGLDHHELWDEVVAQVSDGASALRLGSETRTLAQVFDLLEVYPAFGEDVTPQQVAAHVERHLHLTPRGVGAIDHARLGGRWKRERHEFDLPGALREALSR